MHRKLLGTSAFACAMAFATAPVAMGSAFEDLDKNADGKLSQQEASSVKGLDFAKADIDKNGWLDRAEYKKAVS